MINAKSFVIVRTYSAGVHVGRLSRRDGKEVVLTEARRIWRWRGANTLNELAIRGASMDEHTRISEAFPGEVILTEAIEVIEVGEEAVVNLTTPRWL